MALPSALYSQQKQSATNPATRALVKHALESIGLDRSNVVVDQTELKSVDHFLPFAPGRDTILRIHVKNFKITQKGDDGKSYANPYIHSLNLFYSENAGQVVEILSDLPHGVKVWPFPSVREQEKALKTQSETYAWAPLATPRVKLMKAFDAAIRITQAKQILVYYTLCSENYSKTKNLPVWEIYQRGLPGSPTVGGNYPPNASMVLPLPDDDYTTTVNSKTGKGEGEGTSLF